MEFAIHGTLTHLLKRRKLSELARILDNCISSQFAPPQGELESREAIRGVCEALKYMHSIQYIHRDVKPDVCFSAHPLPEVR